MYTFEYMYMYMYIIHTEGICTWTQKRKEIYREKKDNLKRFEADSNARTGQKDACTSKGRSALS